MRRLLGLALIAGLASTLALGAVLGGGVHGDRWTSEQRERIASLSLSRLPPLPADPSNAVADDAAAADLGKALFFDTRLSANGQVACATCHDPKKQFQDGKPVGQGVGTGNRRTMPIAGTAYSPWMFWDGRADSQWAQALGPLENPLEHGSSRAAVVKVVAASYAPQYRDVFGSDPSSDSVDRTFANVGKAIAAFERTIMPGRTAFDDYADAVGRGESSDRLTGKQIAGLELFIGKGKCRDCHNGPLFTDNDFHNIGVPGSAEAGRLDGARKVQDDTFNCLGEFSDATPEQCMELAFIKAEGEELEGAFKTPSLRGAVSRPPFMHAGTFNTIEDVLSHYNTAPPAAIGHTELTSLSLTADELEALIAFLNAIGGA